MMIVPFPRREAGDGPDYPRSLAYVLKVEPNLIKGLLAKGKLAYQVSNRPKKGGGVRHIYSPEPDLLYVQRKLLHEILCKLPVSASAHGFVKERSIFTNAAQHTQARSILCLDLLSAFDYAHFDHEYSRDKWLLDRKTVSQLFDLRTGLIEVIADLTELRTEKGWRFLPQGAPTSPQIFNHYCRFVDWRLEHLAENVGGTYTRYADNIAFSVPRKIMEPSLRRAVIRTITDHSEFELNFSKTRYIANANRPGVPLRLPGINIIDEEARLTPGTIRHLRIALWCAGKALDSGVYNGIRGHVMATYGEWPPQLKGVYQKAAGLISSEAIPETLTR